MSCADGNGTVRYAIITPYYKEERRLIERCMASVRKQTVPTDHFLIADGHPQDWIDGAGSGTSSSTAATATSAVPPAALGAHRERGGV
jgi:cellulose synthase/poly-beta-1,6-N-acetylglucosamine synthase-like glycosyltransferase